jgi:1-acyl-sn-glycerol-3-phosphate acyltransferase
MIPTKRQSLPLWFFTSYFRILQKLFFRKVEYTFLNNIPEGPVLLLQNHFSWWDGYWSYFIAEKLLHRRFHVMMLESELKKRMFLTRTGAFSVDPEGKQLIASMRYAGSLLNDPRNLITLYPQGKIESHYLSGILFGKGAETLLRLSGNPVQIVFAAAHIRFGSPVRPKAEIFIRYFGSNKYTTTDMETAYNIFYNETRKNVIASED